MNDIQLIYSIIETNEKKTICIINDLNNRINILEDKLKEIKNEFTL